MPPSWPSERTERIDPQSGARVLRWTASPAKDQHLYFTGPSVTDDDRRLVILSERTGHPNLLAIDRASGELHQVSDNRAGLLHAYVYPYGGDTGLSKASPSMDARSGRIVWVQDHAVWTASVGADGRSPEPARRVVGLPGRMVSGFTHVSAGGALACVPVAAPEASEKKTGSQGAQMTAALDAFHRLGLECLVLVVDLERGGVVDELAVPFWVTHVMFSASDPSRIVFNQEGGGSVSQRTWCWQRASAGVPGAKIGARPLYPQLASEWMTHENFDREGRFIIAHGGKRAKGGETGRDEVWFEKRDWNGRLEARYPTGQINGQHAVVGTDGQTVLLDPPNELWSWNMRTGATRLLCQHGSSRREQDCHVHPVMTADGKGVVFTSDRDGGVPNVYEWRAE